MACIFKSVPKITLGRLRHPHLGEKTLVAHMLKIYSSRKKLGESWIKQSGNYKLFCAVNGGIEEAKILCSGPPKKNARLNPYIVPIRPSLFNSKNLKELKVTGTGNYSGDFNHSWINQITENLPVRHVRNLKVIFEDREALCDELNGLRALTTLLGAQVQEK